MAEQHDQSALRDQRRRPGMVSRCPTKFHRLWTVSEVYQTLFRVKKKKGKRKKNLKNLELGISYSLYMGVTNAFQGLFCSIVGCRH